MARTLIIGKTPPPIGGVTIHVQRLLGWLEEAKYDVDFYDMSSMKPLSLVREVRNHDVIHVNVSNSYLCLVVALIAKFFGGTVVVTYHGNVGRWGRLRNFIDRVWLTLVDNPLVLNQQSLDIVRPLNANVRQVSAFLPPVGEDSLVQKVESVVTKFCSSEDSVYCTNAYDFVYDSNGIETYSITNLISIFAGLKGKRLIVSDPSGAYGRHFESRGETLPDNVLMISEPHSFYAIIKVSDVMLRATSTDGDSLSVREALHLGVPVLASDCVERPKGVILYKTGADDELRDALDGACEAEFVPYSDKHGLHDILEIYSLI